MMRRLLAGLLAVSVVANAAAADAPAQAAPSATGYASTCTPTTIGWCIARRIAGDVADGELGFRFGEPLDADGDGVADIAAGIRFKLQNVTDQNGMAAVWSGATGAVIRSWDGKERDGLFGHSVIPMPDLSGDGLADIIAAAPNAMPGRMTGLIIALSPKTGAELWRASSDRNENLGWDMARTDDHDGDGTHDIFVGAPGEAGRVHLYSGRSGKIIRTFAPPAPEPTFAPAAPEPTFAPAAPEPTFGWYVADLADLDGDGHHDLGVGLHAQRDGGGELVGGVYVYSAASGREMFHWTGTSVRGAFGKVLAGVGDWNGDARGEIIVGAPRTDERVRTAPGDVFVRSGADGSELRRWHGLQPDELYGRAVAGAGDIDGDGIEDAVVSAPRHRRGGVEDAGRLEIRSGRAGDVLYEMFGERAGAWFGWHVTRAPDPEGKGRPALLVGSLRYPVDGKSAAGVIDWLVLQKAGTHER